MSTFLTWIEQSALGHVVRDSSPWTYPLINLAHILGIATLFGSVLVMDLAVLRAGRARPAGSLGAIANAAAPLAGAGFGLAALSGIGLLSANGSEYAGNPFFLIKFPVIALGLLNAWLVERSAAWRALRRGEDPGPAGDRLPVLAATSLLCWTTAIAAGRLIGYW